MCTANHTSFFLPRQQTRQKSAADQHRANCFAILALPSPRSNINLSCFDFRHPLNVHPNIVGTVCLGVKRLTDEAGVKLARYVAVSTTIRYLDLSENRCDEATYLAMAAALHVNTSLWGLHLYDNQAVDQSGINTAFVDALRVNPNRPSDSSWQLYSCSNDFRRLKAVARQLGHPSLQMVLATELDVEVARCDRHEKAAQSASTGAASHCRLH